MKNFLQTILAAVLVSSVALASAIDLKSFASAAGWTNNGTYISTLLGDIRLPATAAIRWGVPGAAAIVHDPAVGWEIDFATGAAALTIPNGGKVTSAQGFSATAEDGVLMKLGSSASQVGVIAGFVNRQTPVGNVGAGTDELQQATFPANGLTTTGHCINLQFGGTMANNANAKTITIEIGAATILSVASPVSIPAVWDGHAVFCRTGVNAQRYHATMNIIRTDTNLIVNTFSSSGTATNNEAASMSVRSTGTATADNDIVATIMNGWIL